MLLGTEFVERCVFDRDVFNRDVEDRDDEPLYVLDELPLSEKDPTIAMKMKTAVTATSATRHPRCLAFFSRSVDCTRVLR